VRQVLAADEDGVDVVAATKADWTDERVAVVEEHRK
jgi:hypothetical protein